RHTRFSRDWSSDVCSSDLRVTLLRDADNDGRPEVRTVFIDNLNAPYGLAFVDGYLYVAEQDALVRFPYQPGQTRITAPPEEVTQIGRASCRDSGLVSGASG